MKELDLETLNRIEDLENENKRLKQQIKDLEFEHQMYVLEHEHEYEFNEVLNCNSFKKYRHILMADSYYLKLFINVINKYGYEYVNNYMLYRLEKQEKNEENE